MSTAATSSMRVARTYAIDDTRVEDARVPEPGPGDAIVRVRACGLCSSDASKWYVEKKAPAVLGHEPVGEIVRLGADARGGFAPGDRVFVHHHVACGRCHACKRGIDTSCDLFKSSALDPGGFAEVVRVPRENLERDTLRLPASVSFEEGTFIEPLACSIRAVRKLPLRAGDSVLVLGLGVMGLLNVQVARHYGAGLVVGADFIASRRDRARALGAGVVLDPRDGNLAERVRAATNGVGADHVIVGPGKPEALDTAFACAAPGGTLVLFAPVPPGVTWGVPLNRFYFAEIAVTASYSCGPGETREALRLIEQRALETASLVTHRFDLDGVGEAIRLTASPGDALKSLIVPGLGRRT